VSLEPVFMMETAQDWRCRNSAACRNWATVWLIDDRSNDGTLRNAGSQACVWPVPVVVTDPVIRRNYKRDATFEEGSVTIRVTAQGP